MTPKSDTCGFEFGKFHQSTRKSQKWDFDEILLLKVENVLAKKIQIMYMY